MNGLDNGLYRLLRLLGRLPSIADLNTQGRERGRRERGRGRGWERDERGGKGVGEREGDRGTERSEGRGGGEEERGSESGKREGRERGETHVLWTNNNVLGAILLEQQYPRHQ